MSCHLAIDGERARVAIAAAMWAAMVSTGAAQTVSSTPTTPTTTATTTSGPPLSQQGAATAANSVRVNFGDANNVVRLSGPAGNFVLSVAGLSEAMDKLTGADLTAHAATLELSDGGRLGAPSAQRVVLGAPQFLGRTANGWSWLVNLKMDLPANSAEQRVLTLALGPAAARGLYSQVYSLTNQAASAGQYEVTLPGHDWMVSWNAPDAERSYPLLIANKSEPVNGMKIGQASLKRPDDGRAVDFSRFELLSAADAKGGSGSIDLKPNETKTVFLRLNPAGSAGPFGTFNGQIQLVSDGAPAKPVALTAKLTSDGVKVWGAVLVLAGLLVSLFTTNYLQPRFVWLQALRPVALLRSLIRTFIQETTAAADGDADGIVTEARSRSDQLDPAALGAAGLLPHRLNMGESSAGDATANLRKLLNEISDRLAGLIVLRDAVVRLRKTHPAAARPPEVGKAISDLNDFSSEAISAEVARGQVQRVQATLFSTKGDAEGALDLATELTTERVDFLLQQTANLGALIWATVSLAIGVTYVCSDVDFGTPIDLLGMFLWGFGLTTFGAGIQQLTPKSVATQIGFNVPKTGAAK